MSQTNPPGRSAAFDLFITGLIEEKVGALGAKDGAYAKLQAQIAQASEVLEGDFSYSEMSKIEDLQDLYISLYDIENKHLYLEGFRDCICLLKMLEVY